MSLDRIRALPALPERVAPRFVLDPFRAQLNPDHARALLAEHRTGTGGHRTLGGYSAGHRCTSCHRFVSGAAARCGSCGQEHGGIHGPAQSTR